jgi:hypothetical protein
MLTFNYPLIVFVIILTVTGIKVLNLNDANPQDKRNPSVQ